MLWHTPKLADCYAQCQIVVKDTVAYAAVSYVDI